MKETIIGFIILLCVYFIIKDAVKSAIKESLNDIENRLDTLETKTEQNSAPRVEAIPVAE